MWRVRVTIVVMEKKCVTYSVHVLVDLGIQHAMRMQLYYIVICGPPRCTVFFRITS